MEKNDILKSSLLSLRRNVFSRLDRYIIGKFLGTYFFSIILIISVAVVFDISENSEKFSTFHVTFGQLVGYYINFVPYYANLFSALFVFIAVIFFTSKLAENTEIIAMMSSGTSIARILRPYFISAAIIAVLTFVLSIEVIPRGSVKRLEFEMNYKRKRKPRVAENQQLQVDTGVIAFIGHFDADRKSGYNFSLDKFQNKSLVSHLTAQRIQYDTLADEFFHWKLYDVRIRTLHGMREHITTYNMLDSVIIMEPRDLLPMLNQQETLTNSELLAYIKRQQLRGAGNVSAYEVEYHKRFASSFAAFILSTMGFCLSFRKRKGGMGGALGIGLGLSAAYILFQTVSATFAINANWPPFLAAWLPNILFSGIAIYLYRQSLR